MGNELNKSIKVGELSYNPEDVIGRGGSANVYSGRYSLRPVAIKRLERLYDKDKFAIQQREIELMKTVGDHPNVLRCIHTEMNAKGHWKIT